MSKQDIGIRLSAVIVSTKDNQPVLLVAPGGDGLPALPSGPLEGQHQSLQQGLRTWVSKHSQMDLGYVEQLYTFDDQDHKNPQSRIISIGYLALTRSLDNETKILPWYDFFPWEDHRAGYPKDLIADIRKKLNKWKESSKATLTRKERKARIDVNFPSNPREWNEELVLQRYELLWEAKLLEEAVRENKNPSKNLIPGASMSFDHRRILATAMARLRSKIKYRPVVFELLPPRFTLLQLQEMVEALAGLRLHKQNFRRFVQSQGLVEETKAQATSERGRPAKLFAFRREILKERAVAGTKLPRSN